MKVAGEKLGKIGIALLEDVIEKGVGKRTVETLRENYISNESLESALAATKERFLASHQDAEFSKAIFVDLNTSDLPNLRDDFLDFQNRPTTSNKLSLSLTNVLERDFPNIEKSRIKVAVEHYIEILTEELAVASDAFGKKILALATLRSQVEANKQSKQNIDFKSTLIPFIIAKPPVDFIGRESYIQELENSINQQTNSILIYGSAGVGKTALARSFISRISNDYQDGQIEIDLRGVSGQEPLSSEEGIRRILAVFIPKENLPNEFEALLALYRHTLAGKKVVVLLDNAQTSDQVKPLIPLYPAIAIITSRGQISLSDVGCYTVKIEEMSSAESTEFLTNSSTRLKNENEHSIMSLAETCGNLPLALRIISSILETRLDWSISDLLEKLEDKKKVIETLKVAGDSNLNIEAAFKLSYDLLDSQVKSLFRMTGIFPNHFDINSIANVWESEKEKAEVVIGELIFRGLVEVRVESNLIASYKSHDLINAYAFTLLLENSKETEQVIRRYINNYLDWARICQEIFNDYSDESNIFAIRVFDEIIPDLYFSWDLLTKEKIVWGTQTEKDELINTFAGTFSNLINNRLSDELKLEIFSTGNKAAKRLSKTKDAHVHLGNLGVVYRRLNRHEESIKCLEECIKYARESNDQKAYRLVLGNLANTYTQKNDYEKAISIFDQLIKLDKKEKNHYNVAMHLLNLGSLYIQKEDLQNAKYQLEDCLVLAQKFKFRRLEAAAFCNLGITLMRKALKLNSHVKQEKMFRKALSYGHTAFNIATILNDVEILEIIKSQYPVEITFTNKSYFQ
ncbi:MAG: hypothetical protein MHPDNHAH_02694 [Anaerolineales bacterium]|nr:hypothetical protein [Anaerolineales bacterium]